jgi:hypothetical protein
MSELSSIIEARLKFAETTSSAAVIDAANAMGAAQIADTKAITANQNFSVSPTAPASPAFGQLWSDTSTPGAMQVKCYSGTEWVQINPL